MKTRVQGSVLFWLWLPLALSFTLMMLESPVTNAALARFAEPSVQIAGFGVALGLSLLIESPVIMLLATAIAQLSARVKVSEGEPLPIRLHLEYLHLFSPETGDAIGA